MQFSALVENQLILANEGKRNKDYLCPECLSRLKPKKKGPIQAFCHSRPNPLCSRTAKTFQDLEILQLLTFLLPSQEITVEKLFPQIGKTADLVWEKHKIIFQIAAHPRMSKSLESLFTQMGYHLVWLLDDRIFNQTRVLPFELEIRKKCSYFVKIKKEGGFFYDQWEQIQYNRRIAFGPPLRIHFDKFYFETTSSSSSLHFEGDLYSRLKRSSIVNYDLYKSSAPTEKSFFESLLRSLLLKIAF